MVSNVCVAAEWLKTQKCMCFVELLILLDVSVVGFGAETMKWLHCVNKCICFVELLTLLDVSVVGFKFI